MVYRIFVEKKQNLRNEAAALKSEIVDFLGIKKVEEVRIFNRYDVENLDEAVFREAVKTVFSEPQLDDVYEVLPDLDNVFAVEFLPGQFDQRADSAAQCVSIMSPGSEPTIRSAKVYSVKGDISAADLDAIKKHVINPVEAREASLDKPATLKMRFDLPSSVEVLDGFCRLDDWDLEELVNKLSLAMDLDDAKFCRDYFAKERRDPTITEIRMIDTYWSDHCRHTTFLTTIDSVKFEDELLQKAYERYLDGRKEIDRKKPINLMDIGTLAAKVLRKRGLLSKLDESEEINACTVKITVNVDGKDEPWLLLFKNETHNHPTEIEPFGGAATCIGGAIRDPLSGRSYVYAAMRVTGAGDPTRPIEETVPGKLPQRKIVQTAAAGYSSYGNQIGLSTGIVDEVYDEGYVAKRMEIGAVIAAAPQRNVKRLTPSDGDVVILLGGRTGRDGIGGATGSSKAHDSHSVETCGAQVQKGNAPEERKLQRLFRNEKACKMIKRCNDFGAGGVSVAVGELADGLDINLDAVPKKYEGLDGTELAVSESQERMAVVVSKEDAEEFIRLAGAENLEASVVARVTAEKRLKMSWKGKEIVNISREFLNSNGAEKHIDIAPAASQKVSKEIPEDFERGYTALAGDLNVCSKRGLSERFDSTIGAGSVLMPFGGKYQRTPVQTMVNKISLEKGETDDCSFMSWGFNPEISKASPYHGAYLAVVESLCKLVASGASLDDTYLSFQEYFEKPRKNPKRWGKPFAALLGAYSAQMDYGVAAIGGKDSMSGSFEKLDVPPTLVSFAVTTGKIKDVISDEFKRPGKVRLLLPDYDENGLPKPGSVKENCKKLVSLMREGKVRSAYTPTFGGVAEAVLKACMGNGFGFEYDKNVTMRDIFGYSYGAFVVETDEEIGVKLGEITEGKAIVSPFGSVSLTALDKAYENRLESVYPCRETEKANTLPTYSYQAKSVYVPRFSALKPRVIIPVFPGTNCEYDTAKAFERAGAESRIYVINNLTSDGIKRSVEEFAKELDKSQIAFIPGGFSGGDEPDGSGKFIMAFFRNAEIRRAVSDLLDKRDGLMGGICNGFQALIKLGLVPYGKIVDTDENSPTLTFNTIGRHQSKLVRIRVASTLSPWLAGVKVGDVFTVPISHGEGRFYAPANVIDSLAASGRIATQYVDFDGKATDDIRYNPNGSVCAIEGITSPDGRVFGKMGHSERIGSGLYRNVTGEYDMKLFESAVKYFKK